METFTPSAATFHETAELPVDVTDQRTAASVRVGIEAALDNAAYLKDARDGTREIVATYTKGGSPGVALQTFIDTTTADYIYNGDRSPEAISLAAGSLKEGDWISASVTVPIQTGAVGCTLRLLVLRSDAPTTKNMLQEVYVKDGAFAVVTLQGMYEIPDDATYFVLVEAENYDTPGTTVIYGEVSITGRVWRPKA